MSTNIKNDKTARELLSAIRNSTGPNMADTFIPVLYLIYKAKENGSNDAEATIKGIKKEVKELKNFDEYLLNISIAQDMFGNLCGSYSNNDIRSAMEIGVDEYSPKRNFASTPNSIIELAKTLFYFSEGETLLDQGSGLATFLTSTCDDGIKGTGVEINATSYAFSVMRAEVLGKNISLKQMDVFDLPQKKYDKVFSNCPFGMRVNALSKDNLNLTKENGIITRNTSADWAFSLNAVNKTKDTGKAISIVTAGCLANKPDSAVREYLIKNGLIETIILLPNKMFSGVGIQTALIVFSKGNTKINMVNATDVYTQGRRYNTLSDNDIKTIINAIAAGSTIGKIITKEEIGDNAYCLDPIKYLETIETRSNDQVLGEYINVRRAARLTASDLDEYVTDDQTSFKCLSISDVNDYEISRKLRCFKSQPDKSDKYIVNDKDILLTRAAVPNFKSAIYEKADGETVIANGNVYMITVDETRLNPYYLLAFFNSKLGQERLMAGSAGAAAIMLPTETIRNMQIPMVDMAQQKIIGDRMKALIEEIRILNQKIEDKADEITNMF